MLISALATGFVSCKKEDNPVVPVGGQLSGQVQLWDSRTNTLADHSGVTVSIDGPSAETALTDASGNYVFKDLRYGDYNLTFVKNGYGTYRLFNVAHRQATTAPTTMVNTVQLGQQTTTSIRSFTITGTTYTGNSGVSFQTTVSPNPTVSDRVYIRHFLSNDSTVSNTRFTFASPLTSLISNNATSGFTKNDLLAAGFKTGQTIYARIYTDSFQSNSYKNPVTNTWVFPNLNVAAPPAQSFVLTK
ncbi:carboxypeptidase-like regulatory domain-containing protein [Spirosoma montaniterrae]|uniref:carboxypeptidase-like regulatory domain-containing protein n=1 Tax=Spirosoma montaniterrae TaxID=1178516 RepID=UPI0018DD0214|nr:carboxypeptidase-like regulatory domain-containing protein [Spirosoma montaniterrae]